MAGRLRARPLTTRDSAAGRQPDEPRPASNHRHGPAGGQATEHDAVVTQAYKTRAQFLRHSLHRHHRTHMLRGQFDLILTRVHSSTDTTQKTLSKRFFCFSFIFRNHGNFSSVKRHYSNVFLLFFFLGIMVMISLPSKDIIQTFFCFSFNFRNHDNFSSG